MTEKDQIIEDFAAYSQPAKAEIWQRYGLDLVLGRQQGPYIWDHCCPGKFI